jgi:hypothetical protein
LEVLCDGGEAAKVCWAQQGEDLHESVKGQKNALDKIIRLTELHEAVHAPV